MARGPTSVSDPPGPRRPGRGVRGVRGARGARPLFADPGERSPGDASSAGEGLLVVLIGMLTRRV
ncbi:hypothetical protein GY21_15075 [Cryobacterium roopkundense]|uniref:Uncharacterized protein n=1 Tax=Cryobacterium roopkundense TaxID=1001240 RepID=A0A099J4P6_9MICO|nr:hypothetical protein GY21_15075 [Cryobacterium roopkundense]